MNNVFANAYEQMVQYDTPYSGVIRHMPYNS
ncbi:hypothetical protein BH24DEI1_BH24DEI1_01110 [soil metagenome]